jgi:hypothetical protein
MRRKNSHDINYVNHLSYASKTLDSFFEIIKLQRRNSNENQNNLQVVLERSFRKHYSIVYTTDKRTKVLRIFS